VQRPASPSRTESRCASRRRHNGVGAAFRSNRERSRGLTEPLFLLVRPVRFELTTFCSGGKSTHAMLLTPQGLSSALRGSKRACSALFDAPFDALAVGKPPRSAITAEHRRSAGNDQGETPHLSKWTSGTVRGFARARARVSPSRPYFPCVRPASLLTPLAETDY
jgi:hypothetical protein